MVKITSNNKLQFDLVQEALTNHGFKFELEHRKKYKWFGETIYIIVVEFHPPLDFLRLLLSKAEEMEDYKNAAGIKNMINRLER